MSKNQIKGRENEAKGRDKEGAGKVTGNKSTAYKGKNEKHGGNSGAVLADLNDEAKKETK